MKINYQFYQTMIARTLPETGYPATLQNFNSTALDFVFLDATGDSFVLNDADVPIVVEEIEIREEDTTYQPAV